MKYCPSQAGLGKGLRQKNTICAWSASRHMPPVPDQQVSEEGLGSGNTMSA